MKGFVSDIWWLVLFRGVALLLFGAIALVWPGLTFVLLAFFFAVYLLIAGIANILSGIGGIVERRGWFLHLALGIVEIGVAAYVMRNPGLTIAAFIIALGILFIVQGIVAIIASFSDTTDRGLRFIEIVAGALGVLAGFIILRYPVAGGLAFLWVLGVYGIIAGVLTIAAALSGRGILESIESPTARVAKR